MYILETKTSNNPTHYILCGLPFSGKTYLGKLLQDKLAFVHVSLDEQKALAGYENVSDDDVPDEVWTNIFNNTDFLAVSALKQGQTVVHETAFVTKKWRDRAKAVAFTAGFQSKIIFLDIALVTIRARYEENEIRAWRYKTPKNVFEAYIQEFEAPSNEEDVIIYDGQPPLEDWIEILRSK
ncbi:MAG: ATP-binding protein [Deltaproteobacteria bacterium]|nr:ATP-binding protein [Deltaproteobacteria bacterium]